MNIKELLAQRAALLAEVSKPETTAERFAEIRKDIDKIDFMVAEARKTEEEEKRAAAAVAAEAKKKAEEEERAKRTPNGVLFDQSAIVDAEKRKKEIEQTEKRGAELRSGKTVTLEKRSVVSSSAAISALASGDINPAFEQVGTLDKLVHNTPLHGAETYKKPFVKTYAEGGITAEGAAAETAEPTMGYATINKIKITAYAEITEETEKLPDADYIKVVDEAAYGAYRKKLIQQIIAGSGSSQMVGIINAPTSIIEASQTKTIATVDENTLDNIIFDYGGDEDVEGDAFLILNKLTLKAFATVKGTDKKRAYDIVIKGNTGTINGIPFVCTSKLAAFATVTAGNPYMLYGKLQGYELTEFAPVEMAKSTDYKFKEGMIAVKVSGLVGGSPAMWNGFMKIIKATT
jgi:HK97 family phage major capsid protein